MTVENEPVRMFSEEDLRRLTEAITRVEKKSRIEIVPFIAPSSDAYVHGTWKAIVVGGLMGWFAETILRRTGLWIRSDVLITAVGVLFYLAYLGLPSVRRLMIGMKAMDERAWTRAREVFLMKNLFATRYRNAVLLYISLFEKEVVVLADEGVYSKISTEVWKDLSNQLAAAMNKSRPIDTFIEAIDQLSKFPLHPQERPGSDNELSDQLIVENER